MAPVAGGLAIYPEIDVELGSENPILASNGSDQTYKTPNDVISILNLNKLSISINNQEN